MESQKEMKIKGVSRAEEEGYLKETLEVVKANVENYERETSKMQEEIDEMLERYHDNDVEVYTALSNTITMKDNMKHALLRNRKALKKPYFGRIVFYDESFHRQESLYIGRGGIARDTTHQVVTDWRAPVANAYYENGLGKCSYQAPDGKELSIDLKLKRTYEIEDGRLLDYFDTEVIANDDLLTKYLAKNKQAVLGEIIATIQKEQNEVIRKSPYHNIIVQGVAGSGKTTVAMHRISYILYNYAERFRPDDFYIVGSNRILLEYITGVLPDLDVYGIRQMTMEQLFVRLLYEDWEDGKFRIKENVQAGKQLEGAGSEACIRGSFFWFRELESFCKEIERESVPTESIYLNPKQFVEGIRDGVAGVFDESADDDGNLFEILSGESIADYLCQNPALSVQTKINMLNERLSIKIRDEIAGKNISYTEKEQKAILKAYRGRFGKKVWKRSVYSMYRDFLLEQRKKGHAVELSEQEFDVYDLAALAYLYKRIKETEVISEAHHVVIDEAQDFGMMAYAVLDFCIKDCTYTVMGDVSQNIHFGYGLNDWEELKGLLLKSGGSSFNVLKKSYRNTVEISEFAMRILRHGSFASYPAEPIIRHGSPVCVKEAASEGKLMREAAAVCKSWQEKGYGTIAVICRSAREAEKKAGQLSRLIPVADSSLEKAVFSEGIMVLPVSYTKGLEFDAVLILDPDRKDYPVDDGHARLLYVAATRALHELCVLHTGNLTGLIADPLPEHKLKKPSGATEPARPEKPAASAKPVIPARPAASAKPVIPAGPAAPARTAAFTRPVAALKPAAHQEAPKSSPKTGVPTIVREDWKEKFYKTSMTETFPSKRQPEKEPLFGDMPGTEKLRPAGHSKIDLSVRWVSRERDGLYLQSRYGVLRLSPIDSEAVRVSFAREGMRGKLAEEGPLPCGEDRHWMYKESGSYVELWTDELRLQADRATGAIQYRNREKKILLSEKSGSRQVDAGGGGKERSWLFLDLKKGEGLYAPGMGGKPGFRLSGSARYISSGTGGGEMPFLISDEGYGILVATQSPVIFCNTPAHGSWLSVEGEGWMDFYFLTGKRIQSKTPPQAAGHQT